ncbi:hypothetical protein CTAYLR_004750 [Chrysophaeum taylorii]|uniref:Uncharacterized protein n=1 Tax=Chrysophaeum taylorii TaxID=2483200 RepID=A0AAD7U7U2_9STRA|nr:hypothetical protein CTAYLR_004750 [Chrysophaeum taylorii]
MLRLALVARAASTFPASSHATARNADPDAVFVVSGASRGIGAEFCAQLLERTAGTIVACCRDLSNFDVRLRGHDRVRAIEVDVADVVSVKRLGEQIDRCDVLINNAGVLHDATHRPERSVAEIDPEWLLRSFAVNAGGAVLMTQALATSLRRPAKARPTVVANLSARVGSITDNRGWYSYRMSKSALNMATKCLSIELKRHGTIVVSLHPGTTDTDLSAPYQRNVARDKLFDRSFTAHQLLTIIDGLEWEHTGGFFAWDGEPIEF